MTPIKGLAGVILLLTVLSQALATQTLLQYLLDYPEPLLLDHEKSVRIAREWEMSKKTGKQGPTKTQKDTFFEYKDDDYDEENIKQKDIEDDDVDETSYQQAINQKEHLTDEKRPIQPAGVFVKPVIEQEEDYDCPDDVPSYRVGGKCVPLPDPITEFEVPKGEIEPDDAPGYISQTHIKPGQFYNHQFNKPNLKPNPNLDQTDKYDDQYKQKEVEEEEPVYVGIGQEQTKPGGNDDSGIDNTDTVQGPGYGQQEIIQDPDDDQTETVQGPGYGHQETVQGPGYGHQETVESPSYEQTETVQGPGYGNQETVQGPGYGNQETVQGPGYGNQETVQGPGYGNQETVQGPGYGQQETIQIPGHGQQETIQIPGYGQQETIQIPGHGQQETIQIPGHGQSTVDESISPVVQIPKGPSEQSHKTDNPGQVVVDYPTIDEEGPYGSIIPGNYGPLTDEQTSQSETVEQQQQHKHDQSTNIVFEQNPQEFQNNQHTAHPSWNPQKKPPRYEARPQIPQQQHTNSYRPGNYRPSRGHDSYGSRPLIYPGGPQIPSSVPHYGGVKASNIHGGKPVHGNIDQHIDGPFYGVIDYPPFDDTPALPGAFTCFQRGEGFYADYHSGCKRFYRCATGHFQAYEFVCPPGTKFNDHINQCDHEDEVYCKTKTNYG